MRRCFVVLAGLLLAGAVLSFSPISSLQAGAPSAELKGSFRLPPKNGWTFVHLQGTPHEIGAEGREGQNRPVAASLRQGIS